MLLKKKKKSAQIALLQMTLSRLYGVDKALFQGGEPMLSSRLSAVITDLQIALENSEDVQR